MLALARPSGTLLDGSRAELLSWLAAGTAVTASFVAGWLTFQHSKYSLAIGALAVLAGIAVIDPMAIATLALPATLILIRGGGSASGSNIAVADLMIAVGSLLSLPMVRWDVAPALRRVLAAAAVYEVSLLLVVAAHPNRHNVLEGAHRLFIISGSLIVGWAVARSGRAPGAIKVFLVMASMVGAGALAVSIAHGLKPAHINSLGFQKNTIGAYMWISLTIVQFRPRWMGISDRMVALVRWCAIPGLIASQSKQSIIALAVVVFFGMFKHSGIRHRSRRLAPALVVAGIVVYAVVSTQLHAKAGTFNSAIIREQANASDFTIWKLDPILGQGMRWFYLPQFAGIAQPTNILYESLVASGIVGTLTYAITLAGTLRVFGRLPRDLGVIASALILGRLVEGIFDSYWIGAETALPWLIAGMALGVADHRIVQRKQRQETDVSYG